MFILFSILAIALGIGLAFNQNKKRKHYEDLLEREISKLSTKPSSSKIESLTKLYIDNRYENRANLAYRLPANYLEIEHRSNSYDYKEYELNSAYCS